MLFGLLLVAELFNVVQALGFWWTCLAGRRHRVRPAPLDRRHLPVVDVFIPTYSEPVDVVEPTVIAATRMRGAKVRVAILDDGDRDEMERMAMRHGVRYVRRRLHDGAKAGNINHALGTHRRPVRPRPRLRPRAVPRDARAAAARVRRPSAWRTCSRPQYYANHGANRLAGAAWSQQALFFGPIARGKDAHRSMFCCGTNVVFRRDRAR